MSNKKFNLLFLFMFVIFRLLFLTKLPIFNDEAIYLDWGQREINIPNHLFYSLYDGRQPLLLWIFGLSQKIFKNPLFSGRIISVIIGLFSSIGIYRITKKIFNKQTARFASILYLIIPILVFYERQALMESAVACIGIWIYYFFIKIYEKQTSSSTLYLSLIIGLGVLIKNSTLIFLLPLLILSIIFSVKTKNINLFAYIFSSTIISQIIALLLYTQPTFWSTLSSNYRYIFSIKELLSFPLRTWTTNIISTIDIIFWQFTPIIFFFIILGIFISFKKYPNSRILTAWIFLQVSLLTIVGKQINPRYLMPFLPLLVIFVAFQITRLMNKSIYLKALSILGISLALLTSLTQIISPLHYFNVMSTFTSHSQKNEYVSSWTSGYGIPEVIKYIQKQSKGSHTIVATRLDAGNPESSILAYFQNSNNIKPIYLDQQMYKSDVLKYDCIKSNSNVYFVSRSDNISGFEKYFTEIQRFYKPEGVEYIGLFELNSDCIGETITF